VYTGAMCLHKNPYVFPCCGGVDARIPLSLAAFWPSMEQY
jgi:hypothetical protein